MSEWKEKLDAFLTFTEQEILADKGAISMEIAKHLALSEYEKFSARRLEREAAGPDTEFEQVVKQIKQKKRYRKKRLTDKTG